MLTIHPDAASFLEFCQAALEKKEALNNLMLGVAARVRDQGDAYSGSAPYLATWQQGEEVTYAAVMTPPYGLLVAAMNEDFQGPTQAAVESLLAGGWTVPSVNGPIDVAAHFSQQWTQRTGHTLTGSMRERLFELEQVSFPVMPPGGMRKAEERDIPVLAGWAESFRAEAIPGDPPIDGMRIVSQRLETFYVWENGGLVAMMANNRSTTHLANVGFVYTPPEQRGKGYATALVAAGSQTLLEAGHERCVLFTDLNNPTTNSIYPKIGYRPVADFEMFRFTTA